MSKEYETYRIVNINYELPEGKTFVNTPPKTVKVNIKSGGWSLFFNYVWGGLPDIDLPLENQASQYISPVNIANKISSAIDDKYTVVNVESDVINIKLDDDNAKQVPVVLDFELKIKNGFMQADSIRFSPREFTISGPKSLMEDINFYSTEYMKTDELSGNFSQKIKALKPVNAELKIEPKEILVTSKIEKYTEGEIVIPIEVINAPDSISILPKNVFIKYRAPLSIFSKIKQSDFTVVATLNETILASGNNTLALELIKQPKFTKVVAMLPPTIEYYFVKEEKESELLPE